GALLNSPQDESAVADITSSRLVPLQPFNEGAGITFLLCNSFNISNLFPSLHLLWKRASRAIGVVLHAKVLVNLKQALLVHDSLQELFSTRIVSEKTGRSCFKPSIR